MRPTDVRTLLRSAAPDRVADGDPDHAWVRGRRRRARRRVTTTAAVSLVALAAVLVGVGPFRGSDDTVQVSSRPEESWTEVAPSPLDARFTSAVVFTGSEFIVWGGANEPSTFGDGAAYDPASDTWRRLAASPLEPRVPSVAAWTGREMLVWGGGRTTIGEVPADFAGECLGEDGSTEPPTPICHELFLDGAAYDPVSDTWRRLADPPIAVEQLGPIAQSAWTGDELLIVASLMGSPGEATLADGRRFERWVALAYRPDTDTWRALDEPPLEMNLVATSVWSGNELILWGGQDHAGQEGEPAGAAYDPETDTWRKLSRAPLGNRQWDTAVWSGEEMIVWGGTDLVGPDKGDGAAYDPETDTWRKLPVAPIEGRSHHIAGFVGGEMVVWGGEPPEFPATGAAYDPTTNTWREIAPAPIAGRTEAATTVGSGRVFIWGGATVTEDGPFADGALYRPGSPRKGAWGPLAVIPGPPSGMQALTTATLVITDDCVTLRTSGPGGPTRHSLVVWPEEGTTWNPESRTITYSDGENTVEWSDGDEIAVGGGGFSTAESGVNHVTERGIRFGLDSYEWVAAPNPSCPTKNGLFIGGIADPPDFSEGESLTEVEHVWALAPPPDRHGGPAPLLTGSALG